MAEQCCVGGCDRKKYSSGMCNMHYRRHRKHGDVGSPKSIHAVKGEPLKWLLSNVHYEGDECLIWPFARDDQGRGTLRPNGGKTEYAHRRMCKEAHGAPPDDDLDSAHSCGNGHLGCVHPDHLRWATRKENMEDRDLHGTTQRGERHVLAKLNNSKVIEIRGLSANSVRAADIAKQYGVSEKTIRMVINNETWRHV